jgi:hypothetical protein
MQGKKDFLYVYIEFSKLSRIEILESLRHQNTRVLPANYAYTPNNRVYHKKMSSSKAPLTKTSPERHYHLPALTD